MLIQQHCIASGTLVHQRMMSPRHRFVYAMRQVLLDLDDVDTLFAATRWWSSRRVALGWFRRRDFLDQPELALKERVRQIVATQLSLAFDGRVMMLTAPRCWGFCFNPLTLYFCFDRHNEQPVAVVAEVHNTPWFQRHVYALDTRSAQMQPSHDKSFHVSPFLPMDLQYLWQFNLKPDQLRIGITNTRENAVVFKSSLVLQLKPVDAAQLDRELWMHLPQALKTLLGIYWQALKMFIKRAPFYTHPNNDAKDMT